MSNRLAYLFFMVALPLVLQGQTYRYNTTNNELVYVHLDKLTYVAGESVRYKAYLADAGDPGKMPCSTILYFTLGGSQEPITWRINIKGKSAAGSFLLPDNLKEGVYTLVAYTNWMRNGPPESFYSQKILVISLSEETTGTVRVLPSGKQVQKVDAISGSTMKVTLQKKIYKPGETVQAEISLPEGSGKGTDISVSVAAENPFKNFLDHSHINAAMPLVRKVSESGHGIRTSCRFPIEDRGFILTGRIIMPQGSQMKAPCNVWLSVADSVDSGILYTLTDSTGEFRFYLGNRYDNKELILQLADPAQIANCRLEVYSKTVRWDTARINHTVDSTQKSYLNTTEDIRMIEAVYRDKQNNEIPPSEGLNISFFRKPDKVIIPADYSDMRNFKEIANNIIPEVRFNIRNEKFHLFVLSPTDTWKDNKMVLLNGVPFTDLAYISTLGTKEIRRIEIYKSNLLIGDITLPGLVCIYTHDLKIPDSYLKSRTIRYTNTVLGVTRENPGNELPATASRNFPDFSNSVYWNPFVKIMGEKAVITFPATLLQGQFEINVEGITGTGIPISASASFEIKE